MQKRFVTNGNANDTQKVVLAYELDDVAFKINLYVIDEKIITKEQQDFLAKEWAVEGAEFTFPEGTEFINPDINSDTILPDHIKTDHTGFIRQRQNDWAVHLLTNKLWESYLIELENLKQKATSLLSYDKDLFNDTKSFWERVLEHKKERNITQERLDKIKEDVNEIFDKLKNFRKSESADFERNSNHIREEVAAKLAAIKEKITDKANFKAISEEIKALQQEYKGNRLIKSDETFLRKAYDDAFHHINEVRSKFFNNKFDSRIAGLKDVIAKMEKSLSFDKKDLDYFNKKAETPRIQSLELQLLKVRIRQLKEVIVSKEDKLSDIYKTMESLVKQAEAAKAPKPAAVKETTAKENATATEKADDSAVIAKEEVIVEAEVAAIETSTEAPVAETATTESNTEETTENKEA